MTAAVVTRRKTSWLILRCPECLGRWPITEEESKTKASVHHMCPSCERPGVPDKAGWR